MNIQASLWKPWCNVVYNRHSIDEQIAMCKRLQADCISIKGTNGIYVFGAAENFSSLSLFKDYNNDVVEQAAKAEGLSVDMWCWVDLKYPDLEADAIHRAVKRWNPKRVKLDLEGTAKINAANTGAFMRSLGILRQHDGSRCEVYIQSYRRPDLHPEILWNKWLTYEADGQFIITGMAPQAYPIGSQDFVGDFQRMLVANMTILLKANRRDIVWHVTLPTFRESGWNPTPDALISGIDFLRSDLGDLLIGVDYWRIGQLWESWGEEIARALALYEWGETDEPIPVEDSTWVDDVRASAAAIREQADLLDTIANNGETT